MARTGRGLIAIVLMVLLMGALPAWAQESEDEIVHDAMRAILHLFGATTGETNSHDDHDMHDMHDDAGDTASDDSLDDIEPMDGDVYADIPHARGEDGAFVLGDPDAPITLIEFADFGCPHCQSYKPVIDAFIEEYVATGQARYEFRTFPTAGGMLTDFAARIAECADEQREGAFWSAYDTLFLLAMSGRYDEKIGMAVAERHDLDYDALLTCTETAHQVDIDVDYAHAMGIQGTPGVMIRVGDDEPQFIVLDDIAYERGGVPYDVIAEVIENGMDESADA